MKEFAVLPLGINSFWGDARNPYNMAHETGGSSSGSANAVAAGLVPLAVGTDGGGSIRVPASLCGIVGLKPTHGRIAGVFTSVAVAGPMTATIKENAALYLALAGADSRDPTSIDQPTPHLARFNDTKDLSDVKIGVYWKYFQDSVPEALAAAQRALDGLAARGAKIVDIEIKHLQVLDRAHKITIMSEFANSVQSHWLESQSHLSIDTHAPILLGRSFSAKEYISAQKMRRHLQNQWNSILNLVDVIITPSTAIPSPKIESKVVDTTVVSQLMRFITASNFLGFPALTVPAGYSSDLNLPLGVQLIGKQWQEHVLYRLGNAIESEMFAKGITPRKPATFFDITPKK